MSKRNHAHVHAGPGGSPFPPLGLAASGAANLAPQSEGRGREQPETLREGLPPAPSRVDTAAAQQCRLQDAYWSDDEEDLECPLCLEEIDLSDANFKPCPCGYQICRFCWHHIKQNLNGRCPACRRKYSDQAIEFKPMSSEEMKRLTQAKRQKEKEKKELENMNRKHLANMRVVQKNLVYVVGLSSKLAKEELIPTLRSNEYFGQYGRISKILISKRTTASKLVMGTSESNIGVYVTYHRKEDAARAIVAIDGSKGTDGKILRASYGTTKYCTTYLRNLSCTNPACTYLHEPGEEADSFTKEDLSTLRHAAKDLENKSTSKSAAHPPPSAANAVHQHHHHQQQQQHHRPSEHATAVTPAPPATNTSQASSAVLAAVEEASALPKTASWASGKPGAAPAVTVANGLSGILKDVDMPPLSAAAAPASSSPVMSHAQRKATKSQQQKSTNVPISVSPATAAHLGSPVASKKGSASAVSTTAAESTSKSPKMTSAPQPLVESPVATTAPAPPASAPSAPPGLARASGPPPGLGTPSTQSGASGPSYQPSASAQALLDDLRNRRAAEPTTPAPSPFPDFDYTLSRFSDGEFSFNFPSQAAMPEQHDLGRGVADGQDEFNPGAFVPFGASGPSSSHGLFSGLMSRTGSQSNAADSPSYAGSFDPFSADEISLGGASMNGHANGAESSRTIDELKRTLTADMEQRREHNAGGDDGYDGADDPENQTSRFDFAKRDMPPRAPQQGQEDGHRVHDVSALSKSVADVLEGLSLDSDRSALTGPGQHQQNNHRETNIYGRATQAQAQAAQQAAAQAQQQHHVPQQPQQQMQRPPGLAATNSYSGAAGVNGSSAPSLGSNNWYHELQQQRAREQQQQHHVQQQPDGLSPSDYLRNGPMSGNYTPNLSGGHSDLLAQLMGGPRRNFGPGGSMASPAPSQRDASAGYLAAAAASTGADSMAYFDPAILSHARQQQGSGGSVFSPYDGTQQQQQNAFGGGHPSAQQQQQQQQNGAAGGAGIWNRSPYQSMS